MRPFSLSLPSAGLQLTHSSQTGSVSVKINAAANASNSPQSSTRTEGLPPKTRASQSGPSTTTTVTAGDLPRLRASETFLPSTFCLRPPLTVRILATRATQCYADTSLGAGGLPMDLPHGRRIWVIFSFFYYLLYNTYTAGAQGAFHHGL